MTYPQQPVPTPPRYAGPAQPAYVPGQLTDPQSVATAPGAPGALPTATAQPGYVPSPYGYAPTLTPTPPQGPGKKRGKAPWIIGGAAVLVLAAAGAGVAVVMGSSDTGTSHAANSPAADRAEIAEVTNKIVRAELAGDTATILNLTTGTLHDRVATAGLPSSAAGLTLDSLSVDAITITGDTATAIVNSQVTLPGETTPTPDLEHYSYTRTSAGWKASSNPDSQSQN